jgi:hypothetical protein
MPDDELRTFRSRLGQLEGYETIASPRITTGHAVQANLLQTTTVGGKGTPILAGVFFNCLPCARGKSTDLTVAICHSDVVADPPASLAAAIAANAFRLHTNLVLVAKMLIPPGNGVFLLDTNHADPRGRRVGVFISSKVQ